MQADGLTLFMFFFFNDTATTEIYTLSLHDALPIFFQRCFSARSSSSRFSAPSTAWATGRDRKSTRLNSSHSQISYAVFCLKKKKKLVRSHSLERLHPSTTDLVESFTA